MSRSRAEKRARSIAGDDDDRGMELGSCKIRRARPGSGHHLMRFPPVILDNTDLEAGDRVEQYYDCETGELRIPVE